MRQYTYKISYIQNVWFKISSEINSESFVSFDVTFHADQFDMNIKDI